MGFGKKATTNTAQQQTISAIQAANQQIIANNTAQAAVQQAKAAAPSVIGNVNKAFNLDSGDRDRAASNVLGILDFIKTTPGGLGSRNKSNTGRLTVLGN